MAATSATNPLTIQLSDESAPHIINAEGLRRHKPSRCSDWLGGSGALVHPQKRLVLAYIALLVPVVSCVATGAAAYNAGLSAEDDKATPPLVHHDCITSVSEFAEAFSARPNSSAHLDRPACVAGLMGLVQRFRGEMLNNQAARRISFAFGDSALEKVLVYGVNGGREIVDLLGLGYVTTPSTFRLLVWKDASARHVRGFWENLDDFMRGIYGAALPDLSAALAEVSRTSFAQLTGCDVEVLQSNPGDFAGARCSEAYVEASAQFPFGRACDEPERSFAGGFATTCLQEINFLALDPPTAVQLRAFLYNCNGFNSLYTGYGYTAEEYDGPLVREFWVENVREEALTGRQAIEFHVLEP